MFRVHEWAEVHRLVHREKCSKAEIAARLGMSRTTVYRLLALTVPPRYERERRPSLLDPHKARIAELLDEDASAPATVIIDHLRRQGYDGGITILKDYLQKIRPEFLLAHGRQRTSYLPGEIVKGAFIGFLPTARAFAKTTVHRWALNWLELGAREVASSLGRDHLRRSVGPSERPPAIPIIGRSGVARGTRLGLQSRARA